MGIWEQYGKRRYLKEGDGKEAPQEGIPRYFYLLITHFWKLVVANLLFIVFCLPVITIPAAFCALNRVCIKLVREGNCFLWSDFWQEFKGSFGKSLPLGLLIGSGLLLSYYLLSLGASNDQSLAGLLFSGLGIGLLLVTALLGNWTLVLTAMLPLGNSDLLRNARSLAVLEWKVDLVMIGTQIGVGLVTFVLLPISLLLVATISISLTQYTLCFSINQPVQRRIITPFEESQAASKEPT